MSSHILCALLLLIVAARSESGRRGPSSTAVSAHLDCKKQLAISDQCLSRAILFGDPSSVVLPSTVKELEQVHCRRVIDHIRCVSEYGRCLKRMPRVLFSIVVRNIRANVVKKICGSTEGKREFMSHLSCFNSSSIGVLHGLVKRLSLFLDHVARNVTANQALPHICCGYFYIMDQGMREIDDLKCPRRQETSEYIVAMVKAGIAEAIDLSCGGNSSVDVCMSKLPQVIREVKSLISRPNPHLQQRVHFTPMVPMIQILQNMDSSDSL